MTNSKNEKSDIIGLLNRSRAALGWRSKIGQSHSFRLVRTPDERLRARIGDNDYEDVLQQFSLPDERGTLNTLGATLLTATDPHHAYVIGGPTEPTELPLAQHITISDDDGDSDNYRMIVHHLDWTYFVSMYSNWRFEDLFSLAELHELCHWALDEEKPSHTEGNANDDHNERWNRTLINHLEYVSERELPHQIKIDHSHSVMNKQDSQEGRGR